MEQLSEHEDLGTYEAEAGKIKVKLNLHTDLAFIGVVDCGMDVYRADIKFYIELPPDPEGDCKEVSSVGVRYSSLELGDIFAKLKKAEQGIEELLADYGTSRTDWRISREVVRCILSLEDQTQHLYEKRRQAKEERKLTVFGDRHYGERPLDELGIL